MPARAPCARSSRASRTGAAAASTWKVTDEGTGLDVRRRPPVRVLHCAAVGRDPAEIERSTLQGVNLAIGGGRGGETAAQVVDRFGNLADAGAEHVIFSVPGIHDPARIAALAEVIPALKAL